jgi:spore germination protein
MKNLNYLLGIFVVALSLLSVYLVEKNNQLERQIVATYTSEFSTASEQMVQLQNAVHQSLLFQDEKALAEELTTITRLSSTIKHALNKLPIDAQTAMEWNAYLSRLGSTANEAKITNSNDWVKTMQTASKNLDEIVLSWQDVSNNIQAYSGNLKGWNQIDPETFAAHSKKITGFRETDFPLTASESDNEKKRDLQFLMDKVITKEEAIQAFKAYFPEIENATLTVTKNKDDAAYPFYHIQFVQGARIGYADVTEKGGHILSFLLERPVSNKVMSHEEIRKNAEDFLDSVGYKDITYVESRENHTVWHFVYSRVTEDGTIVYPDSIQVKVAKDEGEVIGVNAMEYIQKENLSNVSAKPLDLKTFFQPDIEVVESKKIYTNNKQYESRLCYEVIAYNKQNPNHIFKVIIDSETHSVLKIEKMQ